MSNSTSYITDFDVPMTKKLLDEIICKMEDNGFIIHGASFDCGNGTLIKDCGMSSRGEFSFPNPRDPNRNVYLFPGMFENKNIISSIILSSIWFKINGLENSKEKQSWISVGRFGMETSNFGLKLLAKLHNLIIRPCTLRSLLNKQLA